MNTKQLFATSILAFVGSGAFAAEYTDFAIPSSTLSRAEVRAEMEHARASAGLHGGLDADQRPFSLAAGPRSRDEVRAEAWRVAHESGFNPLTVGG